MAVSMMLAQTSNTLSSKSPGNLEAQQLQALIAAHQQQQALYGRVPPALWPGLPSPFGQFLTSIGQNTSPTSSSSSSSPVSPSVSTQAGPTGPAGPGVVSPRPMLPLGLQRFTPYVLPKASTPPLTSKSSPPPTQASPGPSQGSPIGLHEPEMDTRSSATPPSREVSPPTSILAPPSSVSPPRN